MFKDYYLVNTEIFDQYGLSYPETYDQFISVCGKFADGGLVPMAVGSKGGNPSHFFFAEVWYQFGTQEYMNKVTRGDASYVCPETIKAAEIILDMAKNRVFPKDPIGSGDFGPPVALYNEGKAAMIVAQTWMIRSFEEDIVNKSEIINMPKMPGSKVDPKTFTVGGYNNTWAVKEEKYHDPKTHDAFVALLDALTSDAFYLGMAESGQSIPAKKVPIKKESVSPLYYMMYQFYLDQENRNMHWGHMPDPVSQEVFSTTMDELWTQNIAPKAFADKIQASIDKALK
jgi:ABC-type glycerol-3-phosphate transport system substrate-binding protein